MDVPLSWRTDIAVLVASGSSVEEHADHLVVRTPTDPTYDWGNFVMVTDPGRTTADPRPAAQGSEMPPSTVSTSPVT